ncbi:hypothetical protein [Ferrimicrobium sp.]|uniref:hypothetical protein n=1 Tax=Ferrimicrobium sp. TaxID=2926050 RepID=UPI002620FC11|nr:hypothetical protein [Ferrimicrobium sp.]
MNTAFIAPDLPFGANGRRAAQEDTVATYGTTRPRKIYLRPLFGKFGSRHSNDHHGSTSLGLLAAGHPS